MPFDLAKLLAEKGNKGMAEPKMKVGAKAFAEAIRNVEKIAEKFEKDYVLDEATGEYVPRKASIALEDTLGRDDELEEDDDIFEGLKKPKKKSSPSSPSTPRKKKSASSTPRKTSPRKKRPDCEPGQTRDRVTKQCREKKKSGKSSTKSPKSPKKARGKKKVSPGAIPMASKLMSLPTAYAVPYATINPNPNIPTAEKVVPLPFAHAVPYATINPNMPMPKLAPR